MMLTLAFQEITTALQLPSGPAVDALCHGVCIDSRRVQPGNLFIAIQGEQFDGHAFVAQAAERGAVAAIVSHPIDHPLPQFVVSDTVVALGQLAAYWRARFSVPVIAVTGSNGKTTLKNMIGSMLLAEYANDAQTVLMTEGNLNNHIGLPLMLCRFAQSHRVAVLEMGMNHFGEISYLTNIAKPTVAVINNAFPAHLEGVGSIFGVAQAKGEIFSGLSTNGIAVINQDDQHAEYWKELVAGKKVVSFGLNSAADVTATDIVYESMGQDLSAGTQFILQTQLGTQKIRMPLLGEHNVCNALAASACALAVGVSLGGIAQGLAQLDSAKGRLQPKRGYADALIIDDTYNANPASLAAALQTCAQYQGKKILVLGDMRELGVDAENYHRELAKTVRACGFDELYAVGSMSALTVQALRDNAHAFQDKQALVTALKPQLNPATLVLVKGSRSMRMEEIVNQLSKGMQYDQAHIESV
jgi:UDP-N-acetylmuramoyl-tripeptide--D-alanyl-D-alanine ligase